MYLHGVYTWEHYKYLHGLYTWEHYKFLHGLYTWEHYNYLHGLYTWEHYTYLHGLYTWEHYTYLHGLYTWEHYTYLHGLYTWEHYTYLHGLYTWSLGSLPVSRWVVYLVDDSRLTSPHEHAGIPLGEPASRPLQLQTHNTLVWFISYIEGFTFYPLHCKLFKKSLSCRNENSKSEQEGPEGPGTLT